VIGIFPKCGIDHCGSRNFRLIKKLKIGNVTYWYYQCAGMHLHIRTSEIKETQNPLEVLA